MFSKDHLLIENLGNLINLKLENLKNLENLANVSQFPKTAKMKHNNALYQHSFPNMTHIKQSLNSPLVTLHHLISELFFHESSFSFFFKKTRVWLCRGWHFGWVRICCEPDWSQPYLHRAFFDDIYWNDQTGILQGEKVGIYNIFLES